MKKLLTFFMVALLTFGVGWAAEVTFSASSDLGSVTTNGTTSTGDHVTKDGITVTSSNGVMGNGQNYRVYQNGTLTVASTAGNISKIEMTFTASGTSNNGPSKLSASGYTYSGYVGTWQGTAATTVVFNATAQARITQIVVTVDGGGTTTVDAPTISPESGDFLSSLQVSISHPDADHIYYTTNGDEPTTSSTEYSGSFTINQTTTVKAIAEKDGVTSTVASATYTKTGVANIAEALTVAQGSQFTFTGSAVVTYQTGRYVWIRDNSGSGLIYRKSGETSTLNNGDILDANWSATNTTYNSVPEFSNPTGVASSSNGGTVAPFDKTSTGVTSANVNEFVSFSNVTPAWDSDLGYSYVTINNNKVYFRNTFFSYINNGLVATSGNTYNIEGIVYTQNNQVFVYMTKVTAVSPTLTANPTSLTINDSGTGNTFTVEGSNLGGDNAGVTHTNSDFSISLSATTGDTYAGNNYQGFTPANGSLSGTVAMSYNGRDLSASDVVTIANNVASTTEAVDYVADLYIVTDNGVTNDWHFDGTYGEHMTYDNGVYTASFTAENPTTFILFARKLGDGVTWNTRYVFGPSSGGDWWLPASGNGNGTIDLNTSHPIRIQDAGTYIITINANAGTFTITKEVANEGDFVLVTDATDLEAGNEVIIVNSGTAGDTAARTMGERRANNYYGTGVTVSNTLKVTPTNDTQIFTLERGTGGFYFKTSDDLYLNSMGSGNNNNLQTKGKDANGTGTSLAVISIDSNNKASIVFQGSGSRQTLRYNANNGGASTNTDIFSCYQSATNQADVYIYQRTASVQEPEITVNPTSLDLVIPAGASSMSGTVTVTETNTSGTTSVSVDGDHFIASLNNGELNVTYDGTATQANPDQATITLTNGTATATVTVTGYKEPLTVTITPADGHTFQGSTVSGLIESNVTGATIEYSFDGINWQTYDPDEGFTATVSSVGGTVTVYARATFNGETANAQATYTRIAQSTTCTADIVFAPQTNNGEMSQWSTFITHIGEGLDYLSGGSVAKLWTNTAYNAMRFGSGSYTGELNLTLDLSKFEGGACKLTKVTINAARYGSDGDNCHLKVSTDVNTTGVTLPITNDQTAFADYVFNFDGSEITTLTIENTSTSNGRVYVHSITLEYSCGSTVEAPVITPASGTYYEGQTVEITAESGATIYYTTDGSEPTTSSAQYNGSFNVPYVAGGSTTVKAIAVVTEHDEEIISEVASETYEWGIPTVTINPGTHNTNATSVTVTLTGNPDGATIYYTTDGSTPSAQNGTEYDGPFSVDLDEIGDEVTVKAIAVYNGQGGTVASATYTRVEKMIEVNTPFFSPLQNNTYYGNQTLVIGCTTPNAEIYYEIIEASGSTAPNANSVPDPTKSSNFYEGTPYQMTVGNSYYVKAIAYIGNYVSTIAEGWYTIEAAPTTQYTYATLKDFNDNCPTGVTAHLLNPVQVVYHSTYTNNGEFAEFCYLRDNTDYACVYFGKRDNNGYTIFNMGDWIDGSQIAGVTNIWERNFHIQLGTGDHEVTSWPSQAIGWSEILPEDMTNDVIIAGTADGDNVWGHYVHLRNTRLSGVTDYSDNDPKHTGLINDGTANAQYYDKFYRWSAGTCSYNGHNDQINCLGDYDQDFFTTKQNAGATFDVYGVIDYYSLYTPPFEVCPIDFLWTYKPVINPTTTTSYVPVTVDITATQPEWAAEDVVIYYKTDDMEEWAVYTEPITVNSTTTVQAYAEVLAEKTDGTNYNDYVRSEIVTETYTIEGIEDPTISPESCIIPVVTGLETQIVTITDHNDPESGAVTTYTVNGVEYTIEAGQSVNITVSETTTVTAVSSIVKDGHTMYSNEASETYTFARSNGIEYNLLKTAPVVGNIYVIVSKAANMGMSNTQNDANRGAVGVLFKENTNKETVYGNDDIAQFVLEQVSENRYYFKSLTGDGGYLCVETNEFANLVTTPTHDASGYDVATVTIGGNNSNVDLSYPATITFTYEGKVRTMRYYANNRTFSTYTDGNLNEPVFLYGAQVTPLHVIERDFPTSQTEQITVSDRLIGVWAAKNILWAKDQNYASIDATSKRDDQLDYVREKANFKKANKSFQSDEWEQSNWVMLDFTNTGVDPSQYVGYEFDNNSVVGYYVDDKNYTIKLLPNRLPVKDKAMQGYPGYNNDPIDIDDVHNVNHYVSSNFYEPNLNWGSNNGFWYEGSYNGQSLDTCIFFMNPKICEIAQVWAVWNAAKSEFTIYEREGSVINGYGLDGAFAMSEDLWQYNRRDNASDLTEEQAYGSVQQYLKDDAYYMFHVAIMRDNYNYGHRKTASQPSGKRNASAMDSDAKSNSIQVYPLDLSEKNAKEPPTGIREILDLSSKTVESVRYYNILGMESKEPFEGINIIVTRYTDGTISSAKVLR